MKKIKLFAFVLIASTMVGFAQELDMMTSPGEFSDENIAAWETQTEKIKSFRERSIGVFFMPVPLNIREITIDDEVIPYDGEDDLFTTGVGVALNYDFNKSGFGFGILGYLAAIGGENFQASDGFVALKYDFPLGNRLETNFEISPLIGVGSLAFREVSSDLYTGSSFYLSGGARITWRVANNLYFGLDVQTVPAIFDAQKLLGEEETSSEASVDYNFIAQLNLSLRLSIF